MSLKGGNRLKREEERRGGGTNRFFHKAVGHEAGACELSAVFAVAHYSFHGFAGYFVLNAAAEAAAGDGFGGRCGGGGVGEIHGWGCYCNFGCTSEGWF